MSSQSMVLVFASFANTIVPVTTITWFRLETEMASPTRKAIAIRPIAESVASLIQVQRVISAPAMTALRNAAPTERPAYVSPRRPTASSALPSSTPSRDSIQANRPTPMRFATSDRPYRRTRFATVARRPNAAANGIRKFSVNSSPRPISTATNPMPRNNAPSTSAVLPSRSVASDPAIDTTTVTPIITSAPPTKAADAIAWLLRPTRRSPSTTAASQISSGVACGSGTEPRYPLAVFRKLLLEAQHCGDRAERLEPFVVAHDHDLCRLRDRSPHRQVRDVLTLGGLRAVRRAGGHARRAEPAALRAAHAGRVEVLLQQQGLDALLVQRRQRLLEPGRTATAGSRALDHAVERSLLELALVRRDRLLRCLLDVVAVRVLDVDLDTADDTLLEVRMQLLTEVFEDGLRRADEQRVERAPLVPAQEFLGGVLQVVLCLLVDRALVARLRPAALVVAAVHLVVDASDLVEPIARPAEDAGYLAVDQHDAVERGRLDLGERLDERRLVDHDRVVDAARQLDHLEQIL